MLSRTPNRKLASNETTAKSREGHEIIVCRDHHTRATHALDLETHVGALALAQRYGFSFYDALIVSAAIKAGCDIIYSEDMQDGLVVDGGLRIANAFQDSALKF